MKQRITYSFTDGYQSLKIGIYMIAIEKQQEKNVGERLAGQTQWKCLDMKSTNQTRQ